MADQTNTVKKQGPKMITNKDMILGEYPDVFQGIGKFPGADYYILINSSIPPQQTPCQPIPIHLKEMFCQEINKMLHAGVLLQYIKLPPGSMALFWSRAKSG